MFTDNELIFIHGVLHNTPLNFQQSMMRLGIMQKIENKLNNQNNEQGNEKTENGKKQKV